MWIAGGNHNIVRNNHFWDNWRRGTMLFAVPDAAVCGPAVGVNPPAGRLRPDEGRLDLVQQPVLRQRHGRRARRQPQPNGTDFWWDDFPSNTGNCWHDNTGVDGTPASITSTPAGPLLPSDCGSSIGLGIRNPTAETELLGCFASFSQGVGDCPWFTTPPKP